MHPSGEGGKKSLYFECYATMQMFIFRAWATCGKTSYLRCQTCTALCLFVYYSLAKVTQICVRQTQSLSPIVTGKKAAHDKAIVLGGQPVCNARGNRDVSR